ncbi:RCH2 [Symbiodinium sp. CCMP2456]|nr:RCH2 [Symbiodinium sp. CCMP2456]
MYIHGGQSNSNVVYDDLDGYAAGSGWTAYQGGYVRRFATAVWNSDDGELLIYGGWTSSSRTDTLLVYSSGTNSWTSTSGAAAGRRSSHMAVWDASTKVMLVFGGYDGFNVLSDLWGYARDGNSWNELFPSGSAPVRRHSATAVWDQPARLMFVFGGMSGTSSGYLDDLYSYDAALDTWTLLDTAGPTRAFHAAVWADSQIIVYGGHDGSSFLDDVWVYRHDTVTTTSETTSSTITTSSSTTTTGTSTTSTSTTSITSTSSSGSTTITVTTTASSTMTSSTRTTSTTRSQTTTTTTFTSTSSSRTTSLTTTPRTTTSSSRTTLSTTSSFSTTSTFSSVTTSSTSTATTESSTSTQSTSTQTTTTSHSVTTTRTPQPNTTTTSSTLVRNVVVPPRVALSPHGQIVVQSLQSTLLFVSESEGVYSTSTTLGNVSALKLPKEAPAFQTVLEAGNAISPIKVVLSQALLRSFAQSGNTIMVVTEVAPEETRNFAQVTTTGETVLLNSRVTELSFASERNGGLTLLAVNGTDSIVFMLANRSALPGERCVFYDLDLNAWSDAGTELLPSFEVDGEVINASWCRTTHTSLFGLVQAIPWPTAMEMAELRVDAQSYMAGIVLVVAFLCLCCSLLCPFLCRRIRAPTSGHVTLKNRHGKERRVFFEREVADLEANEAKTAQKVLVKWQMEDRSTMEDLSNLRASSRHVVVDLNLLSPLRKVNSLDSHIAVSPTRTGQSDGSGVLAEQRPVDKSHIQDTDEKQALGCDALYNSAESAEVVCAGVDDEYPAEADDLVSAGLDDLYPMETDSIVSAGLDDDLSVVLSLAPIEAYQDGEWVLYFSSTHSCLVPAKILGSGFFLTDDPGELPLYRCRVGTGQMREHVPLCALRTTLEAGDSVDMYSAKHTAWKPAMVLKSPPLQRAPHRAMFQVMTEDTFDRFEVPLSSLRRRFAAGTAVEVYLGRSTGWSPAVVVNTTVEVPMTTALSELSMTHVASAASMETGALKDLDSLVRIGFPDSAQEVEVPSSQLRTAHVVCSLCSTSMRPSRLCVVALCSFQLGLTLRDDGRSKSKLGPDVARKEGMLPGPKLRLQIPEDAECQNAAEVAWQLGHLGIGGEGPPCAWHGIVCEMETCAVIEIILPDAVGDIDALQPLHELRVLVLHGPHVVGDLLSLRGLTKLETLTLNSVQVSGDLSALENLTELKTLHLRHAPMSGDFSGLRRLAKLETLYLQNLHTSGNLASLQNLSQLSFLYLEETGISGDLSGLRGLSELKRLHIHHEQVSGDISNLQTQKLQWLLLRETLISGDMSRLPPWPELRYLDFEAVHLSGDTSGLKHLTKLKDLYLKRNRGIGGDLSGLQDLTELRMLDIDNTNVSGDISSLQNMSQLHRLRIEGAPEISGSLSAIEKLRKMKSLTLYKARKITGNLKDLQYFPSIRFLRLTETGIQGHLSSLRYLEQLERLYMASTNVTGNIFALTHLTKLEVADLSKTRVSGWFSPKWLGCCKRLRELWLDDSRVGDEPAPQAVFSISTKPRLLPALQALDVSRCRFRGTVEQLLVPLAETALTSIAAAGNGLQGDMPNLSNMRLEVDGTGFEVWASVLSESLRALDLSENNVTALSVLPLKLLRMDLSRNMGPLVISPAVLAEAVKTEVDLNLYRTRLANREEVQPLLHKELKLQDTRSPPEENAGYACIDLAATNLRVTPDRFLPEQMCVCRPGHKGFGINCSSCPSNTFSDTENQAECNACPVHSSAPPRASSLQACECTFGNAQAAKGERANASCQCEAHTALLKAEGRCEVCSKLHLRCPEPGALASTAKAAKNFARLSENAEEVFKCLDAGRCADTAESQCADGYAGPLCLECATGYRTSKQHCVPCHGALGARTKAFALVLVAAALVLAAFAGIAFVFRTRALAHFGPSLGESRRLLTAQAPVLLQLAQLWVVLAQLARTAPMNEELQAEATHRGDWFLSYMEVSQLTPAELQNFLALQCRFHGPSVRWFFALATPVLPLLVLASCACLEICTRGTGIRVALKVLTLLYVGGASGAFRFQACQHLDGEGRAIPEHLAFRPLFPHLKCADDSGEAFLVDLVGGITCVAYGIVIPCCFAVLFAKQHVVMQQSKIFFIACDDGSQGKVHLRLEFCEKSATFQESKTANLLVAAAAAHVAVHIRGNAAVELRKDEVIVTSLEGDSTQHHTVSAESLILPMTQKHTNILNRNVMMRMLTERILLEEAESDRIMKGAKRLLCKYASCRNVRMEVALKLASITLVSVVTARDGPWLSVAVCLAMALVIGLARPYAKPQVNTLQSFSFSCLSVAALGFSHRFAQVARLALVAPLLLVVVQLLRPDSAEGLALRLQEELKDKIPEMQKGELVEVNAEQLRLL